MEVIKHNNTIIKYQVIRSNRKTVGLEVNVDDGVKIRAPQRLAKERIKEIVKEKAEWILKKQAKLDEVKPSPAPKKFISGEQLPYLGRRYRLEVENTRGAGVRVKLNQGKFIIQIGDDVAQNNRREAVRKEVIGWYRKHAQQKIKERVKKYQTQVGVKPNRIKVKKQRKRWGSCSSLGNLNFNWKLIMAPIGVIDYIVVHELVHLKQPDHSKAFWQLVEVIIPNYKEKQEWLRINGRQLDIRVSS